MSKELKAFLRAWLWWVMTDANEDNPYGFRGDMGLCYASWFFRRVHELGSLEPELKKLFWKDGLDEVYPFGEADFDERDEAGTMHLCPKRVGWVIKTLKENPDA